MTTTTVQHPQAIIDSCLELVGQKLPGFKQRPAQHAMMTAVAATLARMPIADQLIEQEGGLQNGQSILVIEGPTGTGKSLGYLLPAVVMAKKLEKQLVVSSATVMLQEQLANKDIPFLAKNAGLDISYAIAKGRGRYSCTYRLKQQAGVMKGEAVQQELLEHPQQIYKNLLIAFNNGEWEGDRDSLAQPMNQESWLQITNDRHGCLKKSCPDFHCCPFYTARQKLEEVDIVIANHDLLLADIAMGGGVILPHPAETFYCLDEGHHLADKAIKQFAGAHGIYGAMAWLEKVEITVSKALEQLRENRPLTNIVYLTQSLSGYFQDLCAVLAGVPELVIHHNNWYEPAVLRFKHGQLPEGLTLLSQSLATTSQSLHTALTLIHDQLKRAKINAEGMGDSAQFDRPLIDLGFFISRVENLVGVWMLFSRETAKNTPPTAKWITAQWANSDRQQLEYTVHASPISAAPLLAQRFWHSVAGAVLTSATLRSLGKFDLLLQETGLTQYPETTCIALASPFNFPQQGQLIIPPMQSDPGDPVSHTAEIIKLLPQFLPTQGGHGSLVLFASRRQMQDVAQGLPEQLQQLLLIQGEQSKEILLQQHFVRIKQQTPSILFGLASFAEGLDLPGNACNCLVIAKLPFAVPDEPVSQALADWIEQRGGNPFMEMTLPATSIKLIQAVGRLIRSETDTGTVVIMDTRLENKRYGKLLLKNLPPFRR